jgi:hypothetical protein
VRDTAAEDPAAELETVMRELFALETLTWFGRHRHWYPDGAAIPENLAADIAVDALIHALVPHAYLGGRP